MILISHRGNLNGPNAEKENHPKHVEYAIKMGFDVEIDVWYINKNFLLGHDEPQYKVDMNFLKNKKFWCHAKNEESFEKMIQYEIHCFWHENDKFTLTNKGIPWCFPKNYNSRGITVMNKKEKKIPKNIAGICTDYPVYYLNLLNNMV